MAGFTLTRKAIDDLLDIGRYTQNTWGLEQRRHYLSLLDETFLDLAEHPSKGRDCSALQKGYRKYNVGKHVIFYRAQGTGIEIVRILHERMNVEQHLS